MNCDAAGVMTALVAVAITYVSSVLSTVKYNFTNRVIGTEQREACGDGR